MEAIDFKAELESLFQSSISLSLDVEKKLLQSAKDIIEHDPEGDHIPIVAPEILPLTPELMSGDPWLMKEPDSLMESSLVEESNISAPKKIAIVPAVKNKKPLSSVKKSPLKSKRKRKPSLKKVLSSLAITKSHDSESKLKECKKQKTESSDMQVYEKLNSLVGNQIHHGCQKLTLIKEVELEIYRLTFKEKSLIVQKKQLKTKVMNGLREIIQKLKVFSADKEIESISAKTTEEGPLIEKSSTRRRSSRVLKRQLHDSKLSFEGFTQYDSPIDSDMELFCSDTDSDTSVRSPKRLSLVGSASTSLDFVGFRSAQASGQSVLISDSVSATEEPLRDSEIKPMVPKMVSKPMFVRSKKRKCCKRPAKKADLLSTSLPQKVEEGSYLPKTDALPLSSILSVSPSKVQQQVEPVKPGQLIHCKPPSCSSEALQIYASDRTFTESQEKELNQAVSSESLISTSTSCLPGDPLMSNHLRKTNKCSECDFESPLLGVFKRHQLNHASSNEPITKSQPFPPLIPTTYGNGAGSNENVKDCHYSTSPRKLNNNPEVFLNARKSLSPNMAHDNDSSSVIKMPPSDTELVIKRSRKMSRKKRRSSRSVGFKKDNSIGVKKCNSTVNKNITHNVLLGANNFSGFRTSTVVSPLKTLLSDSKYSSCDQYFDATKSSAIETHSSFQDRCVWTKEEKLEIIWCYFYSRCKIVGFFDRSKTFLRTLRHRKIIPLAKMEGKSVAALCNLARKSLKNKLFSDDIIQSLRQTATQATLHVS